MALPLITKQWVLAKKPADAPDQTFRLKESVIPDLVEDEVLVKTLYLSNDPAQRSWIRPELSSERIYTDPVSLGEPMRSLGIGTVISSKESKLPRGTLVRGWIGWTEYAILNASEVTPLEKVDDLSETHFLGAFFLAGLTAFYGLETVRATRGDTLVVSGAAGATGSMAVQIAKGILGCKRVIGIAGSEEKCRWVESLGADVCVDYKGPHFVEDLKRATNSFVDVFFDNVGGEILDLMLTRMKTYGRIAACGAIAGYNTSTPRSIKNWMEIISMKLKVCGFVVFDIADRFPEITKVLIDAYKDGKIKVGEENETLVETEFENVPGTWMRLFEGGNRGKLITKIVQSSNDPMKIE